MEYEWTPDTQAEEAYELLNPMLDERGRQLQQAALHEDEADWLAAADVYRTLAMKDAGDAAAWYHLGRTLHAAKRYDEAIPAHQKAAASDHPRFRRNGLYNLACAYALTGQTDKALEALEKSIAAGFDSRPWIEQDTDFDAIRDDPRFQALVETIPQG